ncbi:hypothetical protein [Candidatus Finniella inopinata]|uniref:Uncharacterized protein n=1 Tax=Candidatus Finniella inopinata TaxID=1696036 RepID=A0A4Q7DK93_9PROT|nr:hypothetical protein [Candidatus Finniella inopinata]RZI46615.1 hypothetical protein EQU50_03240 [Candidatus Finniella inopinata]
MPAALGNSQSAVPFSVVHDMYPNIANKRFTFYEDSNHGSTVADPSMQAHFPNALNASNCVICAAQRTSPAFVINSQLSIAYLLTKRDGSPLILRFEDENGYLSPDGTVATGDFAGIIQNALAFRTAMDAKNAPHEYILVLDTNTLLIARQYGFAVINMWTGSSSNTSPVDASGNRTISLVDLQKVPSTYIPDGTYKDEAGSSYTKSSSSFNATANSRNIKFFVLQNPPSTMSSQSVVFQVTTPWRLH